jgi:Recombination endonuclease VII
MDRVRLAYPQLSHLRANSPEYQRRWRELNKERIVHYRLKRPKYSSDWYQDYALKRFYGITLDEYRRLLKKQNNACAICKKPERGKRFKRLSVDHDHETGKVRGLLCSSCNRSLGLMEEDPKALRAAARYLEKNR